jgi:hypothetical protein
VQLPNPDRRAVLSVTDAGAYEAQTLDRHIVCGDAKDLSLPLRVESREPATDDGNRPVDRHIADSIMAAGDDDDSAGPYGSERGLERETLRCNEH